MLEQLPHVGAIINAGDDERVKRLIDWLREEVDQRAIRYAAVNADSITQYRQVSRRSDEPRILVLLDGLERYDVHELQAFCEWLQERGLQAIGTRVSRGPECSVIIEDGLVAKPANENDEQ